MEAPTKYLCLSTRPPRAGFTASPTLARARPARCRLRRGCRLFPPTGPRRYGATARLCLSFCPTLEQPAEATATNLASPFRSDCGNAAMGCKWSGAGRSGFLCATHLKSSGDYRFGEPTEDAGGAASGTILRSKNPRSSRWISTVDRFQCDGCSRGRCGHFNCGWKHHDLFSLGPVRLWRQPVADGYGFRQDECACE